MKNKKPLSLKSNFNLNSFFKLVRIEHAVMYAIAVLIGAVLVGGTNAITEMVLIGALVAVFLEFGAFSLNDYIDVNADRINRRMDRPLVTGEISKEIALYTGIFSFLLANIIAFFFLPLQVFYIVLIFTFLSLIYDILLKNTPLLGNVIIALTMAIPFFFGAFIISIENNLMFIDIYPAIFLSFIAFFVGLGREIIKDVEDIKGDKLTGGKTLPILIGKINAIRFAVLLFFFSIILSLIPFFTFFSGKVIYFTVLITDFLLLDISWKLLNDQSLESLRKARSVTLYAIAIGLLSFLLSSIF